MAAAVETLTEPVVPGTPDPDNCKRGKADPWAAVGASDRCRWGSKEKEASEKTAIFLNHNQKLCSVVSGQCTEAIVARIESPKDCKAVSKARTSIGLFKIIQGLSQNVQDGTHLAQTICTQKKQPCKMVQGRAS